MAPRRLGDGEVRASLNSESAILQFEQEPSWQMVSFNLPRDGGLQSEPRC